MRTWTTSACGYTEAEIAERRAELKGKTELDALIAYLQVPRHHAPKTRGSMESISVRSSR